MKDEPFDCCVVDLRLPDMSGFELLDRVQADPAFARPADSVVFTGKELNDDEEQRLKTVAKSIVLKDVQIAGAPLRRNGALPPPRSSPTCPRNETPHARSAPRVE